MVRMLAIVAVLGAGCGERVVVDARPSRTASTSAVNDSQSRASLRPAAAAASPREILETAAPADLAPALEEPTAQRPVVVAAVIEPAIVAPGDAATLTVRLRIAPTWHIYGLGKSGGSGQPTKLELSLPRGVEAVGEWAAPTPDLQTNELGPAFIYHDEVTFHRALQVLPETPAGSAEATCVVTYQACDRSRCLMPAKATATVRWEISQQTE